MVLFWHISTQKIISFSKSQPGFILALFLNVHNSASNFSTSTLIPPATQANLPLPEYLGSSQRNALLRFNIIKTSNKKGIYYYKSLISFLFFVSRSKTLKDSGDIIAYMTSSRTRPIRRTKYIQYKSLFAKCFFQFLFTLIIIWQ